VFFPSCHSVISPDVQCILYDTYVLHFCDFSLTLPGNLKLFLGSSLGLLNKGV
jgi:hypothetical protein